MARDRRRRRAEREAGQEEKRERRRKGWHAFARTAVDEAAKALERDPEAMKTLVELGIVDPDAIEKPGANPFGSATPLCVVERYLERKVREEPSTMATLGLSALQVLGDEENTMGEVHDLTSRPAAATVSALTVAFTDLHGFTSFTASEGDEAASRLITDHYATVEPLVRARSGRIVKRLGDGLMMTFPAPEAGVVACLEMVDHAPDPLQLRAGAHLGDAVVSGDDVFGHVVNVAARLTDAAKGDQVLVSDDVHKAVDALPGVRFGRPHHYRLKGLDERVPACTVRAA